MRAEGTSRQGGELGVEGWGVGAGCRLEAPPPALTPPPARVSCSEAAAQYNPEPPVSRHLFSHSEAFSNTHPCPFEEAPFLSL